MQRLLLRQTSQATLSPHAAEQVVLGFAEGRVVGRDGKTLLVEFDPCQLAALRERLAGWIVSEQGAPVPVPDTCVKIQP